MSLASLPRRMTRLNTGRTKSANSKFYTSNQSRPPGSESRRHKSGYVLMLLAVSFHWCLMWAASYKDFSSHPETSDMCSTSGCLQSEESKKKEKM